MRIKFPLIAYLLTFIAIMAFLTTTATAQKITVGTKKAPPFVIKQENGEWSGISIDLWKQVAEDLGVEYEIKEYDLQGLLNAVENKEVDIAVSPLTITSAREERIDFSQPYLVTGLGIAVRKEGTTGWVGIFLQFFSIEFLGVVALLIFVLFLVGAAVWLFERNANKEEFGNDRTKGLASSFWWAAVTMTTVGYGDKAPITTGGRVIGFIWMFAGIIIISSFTAAIASALTVGQLETGIKDFDDLYSAKVASVVNSSSHQFLETKSVKHKTYESPEECIELLKNEKVDAVVYDMPILRYQLNNNDLAEELHVLPIDLEPVYYGFGLPDGSGLREQLNVVLLKRIIAKDWQDKLNEYLGDWTGE